MSSGGMDNATWNLQTEPSAPGEQPHTDRRLIERSLIRSFRKYASAGAFDDKSEWYALAVAHTTVSPHASLTGRDRRSSARILRAATRRTRRRKAPSRCLHVELLREINEQKKSAAASLRGIAWVYDMRLLDAASPASTNSMPAVHTDP